MAFRKALISSGFLLALALPGAPALAQQPIVGGQLYAATPGPVTVQLLADTTPDSLYWSLPVMWVVGPRWHDFRRTGAREPICNPGPGGDSCTVFGIDDSSQLGKNLAKNSGPWWSNNAPGTTISSPELPQGTPIVFGTQMFDFTPGPDLKFRNAEVATTGGFPPYLTVERVMRQAAIFAGPGNTVRIGFTSPGSASVSENFLDYPIRIQVSNVLVKN